MDELEELLRETLRERAANVPDSARLIDAVRDRAQVSTRRPRLVPVLVALVLVIAIVATAAMATTLHNRGSESRSPAPSRVTTPSTAPPSTSTSAATSTSAPPPTSPTTVTAQPTAECVHAVPTVFPLTQDPIVPGGTQLTYPLDSVAALLPQGISIKVSEDTSSRTGAIVMTRPDGVVTLDRGSVPIGYLFVQGAGDFNGDARPDLLIDVGDRPSYIVSGDLAPGTYDLATVGSVVPVPAVSRNWAYVQVVGDQNHDGAADLLVDQAVYSGRQVMADAKRNRFPAPFEVFESPPVGVVPIDANEPPSFVVRDTATHSLRITNRRADRLVLSVEDFAASAYAAVWVANGHHYLVYGRSSRGGTTAWRWDLDGPCAK